MTLMWVDTSEKDLKESQKAEKRRSRKENSEAGNDSEVPRRKLSLADIIELLGRALETPQATNKDSSGIYLHL